ncbi:hypothetical protein GCM10011409_22340 [Lentibacillus populi]|uniref:Uncharacterized protein n=1 Tax=Lentibacillus populi TaxID=1827502 RepID=A0A9W5X5P6_9BACI|nr:hypothetical protein [Lentibacillus populi]GGB44304.1 hypothetical protein GCM10011409_22340 [Lentibacillus populi]
MYVAKRALALFLHKTALIIFPSDWQVKKNRKCTATKDGENWLKAKEIPQWGYLGSGGEDQKIKQDILTTHNKYMHGFC